MATNILREPNISVGNENQYSPEVKYESPEVYSIAKWKSSLYFVRSTSSKCESFDLCSNNGKSEVVNLGLAS